MAAVTVWDGRISPVFDVSREALVLTVENGTVVKRCHESIEGPMTGWGMGWCAGVATRAGMPPRGGWYGMGWGGGRGPGWRHRNWYHATGLSGWQRAQMGWAAPGGWWPAGPAREEELAALKRQAETLGQTMGELKARIEELEKPVLDDAAKDVR